MDNRREALENMRVKNLKRAKKTLSKQTPEELERALKEAVNIEQSIPDPRSSEEQEIDAELRLKDERFKRLLGSMRK